MNMISILWMGSTRVFSKYKSVKVKMCVVHIIYVVYMYDIVNLNSMQVSVSYSIIIDVIVKNGKT